MARSIVSTLRIACAGAIVPLVLALALFAADARAQSRNVHVNGQRMNDAQVLALARRSCSDIPDGAYWLNLNTGAWGYAGNARVQGVFGDACGRGAVPGAGANADGTHGPFVTMRRAEEEANGYRAQGFRAVAFHNGDGYYVRVSR
jgi:hypothetical protein